MDSPTNQLRRLNAELDQAKIALGQALQPALISVLPVMTNFATGLARVMSGAGVSTANPMDDVIITLADATSAIQTEAATLSGETVKAINALKADVGAAMDGFVAAAKETKTLQLNLKLQPETTVYDRVLQYMGELDQFVGEEAAKGIQKDIQTQLDAVLADGEVTKGEVDAVIAKVKEKTDPLIQSAKLRLEKKKAEIELDLDAGKIDQEEAHRLFKEAQEVYDRDVGIIEGIQGDAIADLKVKDWNSVTLAPEAIASLTKKIEAEIAAGEAVSVNAQAYVEKLFGGTGAAGEAYTEFFGGLVSDANQKGQEIRDALTAWAKDGFTSEQIAELNEMRKEYAKAMEFITTGKIEGDKLNLALFNNKMDAPSLINVATAFTEQMKTVSAENQQIYENLIAEASPSMFNPEFLAKLKAKGFDSFDAFAKDLDRQRYEADVTASNEMAMRAMSALLDSVQGLDLSRVESKDLNELINTLNTLKDKVNISRLDAEGEQTYQNLAGQIRRLSIEEIDRSLPFLMEPALTDFMKKRQGLSGYGGADRWREFVFDRPNIRVDKPTLNNMSPTFAQPGRGGSLESFINVNIEPMTVTSYVMLDETVVGRATVKAQQTIQRASGGSRAITSGPAAMIAVD